MCNHVSSLISRLNVLFCRLQNSGSMKVSTLPNCELGLEPEIRPQSPGSTQSLQCPREAPERPFYTSLLLRVYQGVHGLPPIRCSWKGGQRSHSWTAAGPPWDRSFPSCHYFWGQTRPLQPTSPGQAPGRALGSVRVKFEPKARVGVGKPGRRVLGWEPPGLPGHLLLVPGGGEPHSPQGRIPEC